MDAGGSNLAPISPFESVRVDAEHRPARAASSTARWDYVDRFDMPFMKLWATCPTGPWPQAVCGNFIRNPYSTFEPRAIPGSHKIVFTASAHHAHHRRARWCCWTRGRDQRQPRRPDTARPPRSVSPRARAGRKSYFAGPYPLSEEHYLVSWSDQPCRRACRTGLGMAAERSRPVPVRRFRQSDAPLPRRGDRQRNAAAGQAAAAAAAASRRLAPGDAAPEGRMLLVNVYDGLGPLAAGNGSPAAAGGSAAEDAAQHEFPRSWASPPATPASSCWEPCPWRKTARPGSAPRPA